MSVPYSEAKAVHDGLESKVSELSAALQRFPRKENGLTPDEVTFSPEYRQARADYEAAAKKLSAFDKLFVKIFAKEIRAERRARYAAE